MDKTLHYLFLNCLNIYIYDSGETSSIFMVYESNDMDGYDFRVGYGLWVVTKIKRTLHRNDLLQEGQTTNAKAIKILVSLGQS